MFGYISSQYATVVPDAPNTGGSSDPLAGDANGDGAVSDADVRMMFNYVMGQGALTYADRADLNGNGAVTLSDAALLCRMLGGKLKCQNSSESSGSGTSMPASCWYASYSYWFVGGLFMRPVVSVREAVDLI